MGNQHEQKSINVELTNIELHITKPKPWIHLVLNAINSKKPSRFYGNTLTVEENGEFKIEIPNSPEIQVQINKAEKEGRKINFELSTSTNIFASKDTIEFIEAHKKKNSKIWQKISNK